MIAARIIKPEERPDSNLSDACNDASIGACLANCVSLCQGLNNSGSACLDLGGAAFRFSEHQGAARRTIFRSGDRIDGIPIICSGWAAKVAVLPNNRRQIISILLPGDLVSNSLVFEDRLSFTVEAITHVTYRSFERAMFRAALIEKPDQMEAILRSWTDDNMQVVRLAISLGQLTAEERIAQLLLNLSDRLAARRLTQNHAFHFPLRQRHIAEATGLTPVHVSRVIGQLRQEGLVELKNRLLTIRDRDALERICSI
ncbi:MAG TPA: Crp/Fnr family transcriptional regulator [Xanthobacteraceae bacterium]|nr:Crp/Fnr family transcriptional regulator [Xanthobacteraceae bacterium]